MKTMDSPLGKIFIGATTVGICSIKFREVNQSVDEYDLTDGENLHIETAINQLDEYFRGHRKTFTVVLDVAGTDFQKSVWNKLLDIPYGKTISYKQLSETMGNPLAIRAIAAANGANPVPILIPCHRVIGSNGKLTGYSGGLWRKAMLLKLESPAGVTLFD